MPSAFRGKTPLSAQPRSQRALTVGEVTHAHGDFTGCLQDLHSLKAEGVAQ